MKAQSGADMTANARTVLADCQAAMRSLEECEYGSEWSRHWVTVVSLLRAVGHVLEKVDAKSDPQLARVVRAHFEQLKTTKPQPQIYWQFIVEERNSVLKEYRFRGIHAWTSSSATSLSVSSPTPGGPTFTSSRPTPGRIQIHVYDRGAFAGRNQGDVAIEAIEWWQSTLDKIDALASGGEGIV
jgi:hypothetical protein